MINLICLMGHTLFQIYTIFKYIKNHETIADNPPVQIYTNKIKNRIVFEIKTYYKLELSSSETMKLLGSTKKDVDQDKDADNLVNRIIKKYLKYYLLSYQINNLVN